ncbi:SDR family oxidoreductase [Williamsia serinedens]|uniref:NADH-flavin reductase n=1 Tax=Williamsia serinedens TaxID=391736 RepID=A0ABT1H0H7_9NOCA|nr:SDR family oxidoreductase [Williamsia serinedens]MCP2160740.1 putative NADH-flavin reductase [Williamsia serinedens]
MSRIAIIGGHGKIALQAAKLLTGDGHQVSSVIRNPGQSDDITATGATPIVLDIEKASTEDIVEALDGHDAIVFSAGAGGGNPDRTYAVDRDAAMRSIDAASAASIRRFVLVSYFGASTDHGVDPDDSFYAYAEAKGDADQYLRASDLDWTIVAPSTLSDDEGAGTITTKEQGAERGTKVARADVAAVITAVLESPGSVGRMIEFTAGDTPIADAVAGA